MSISMRLILCSARRAITVLIYLSGIGLPVSSSAEQFRCRVVDQIVLTADQGRSSRYSGFVDGINVGDTLSVELGTRYWQGNPSDPRTASLALTVTRGNGEVALSFLRMISTGDVFGDQIVVSGVNWWPDSIQVGYSGNIFEIQRYYMTDWHGVFTTIESGQAYLAVINCIGVDGAIQRARREFIENPDIDFRTLPDVSALGLLD